MPRLSLLRRGALLGRSSSARSSRAGSPPRTSDTGSGRLCRFAARRGTGFTAGLARKVRTVVAAAALATLAATVGGLSVLAFPEAARAQSPSPSVCDRTPQVRDNIVAAAPVSNCADVTSAHLAAQTRMELSDAGISSLRAGDFAGLTSLEILNLNDNALSSLPSEVFAGLTSLEILNLNDNALSILPSGVFAGLTSLESLGLNEKSAKQPSFRDLRRPRRSG